MNNAGIPLDVEDIVKTHFAKSIPHNKALGLEVVEVFDKGLVAKLPIKNDIVGNPETGAIHGGAVTSLIDATCGMAIPITLKSPVPLVTLDLRIDYLRPASDAVFCRAECYKTTRHIAFVKAVAHTGNDDKPIASATGTFVINAVNEQVKAT